MPNTRQHEQKPQEPVQVEKEKPIPLGSAMPSAEAVAEQEGQHPGRPRLRGTAAMDQETRKEVARKGGLAVSRNKQHMADIGRKGGLTVSKNKEHMARIGRKGGAASRGGRH